MRELKQARLRARGDVLKQELAWWTSKRERAESLGDTVFDVPYHEELAGREGMNFTLLPRPGQHDELVARAARELRRLRDVVMLRCLRIELHLPFLDRDSRLRLGHE